MSVSVSKLKNGLTVVSHAMPEVETVSLGLWAGVGSRGEAVQGNKTEKALGLVVLSKAGESEAVAAAKTCMVGGAVIDKLKGSHAITAGGNATFIGAFHKLEAKGKITLKCGGSSVVIDSSGITVTSPMVTFMAAKLHLPKSVSEA